jgi:hypothetical protein
MTAGSVMETLRELNPNQPVVQFRTLQRIVDHAVSPRRFFVLLVTFFAVALVRPRWGSMA